MHTKNSVQKSPIPSSLKVDNLKHISDHGLNVQFTEQKLKSLIDYLRTKEGTTALSAGKSTLEITKLGCIVMTRLHLATSGSGYWHESIHYQDSHANLFYKVKRQDGTKEQDAFDTLRGVIFGEHTTSDCYRKAQTLPAVWFPKCGADSDKLRDWLRDFAWTLTGVSGLRAQASKQAMKQIQSTVSSAKNGIDYQQGVLVQLRTEDSYFFRISHERARGICASSLKNAQDKADHISADKTLLAAEISPDTLFDISTKYGAVKMGAIWQEGGYTYERGFPAKSAVYSHTLRGANYTATVGEDGETVLLSSGINCEFKRSEIVAWLKGNSPAPKTRYGVVEKVECATNAGEAANYLKCGCHYVDAARIDSELAQLLKPSHVVSLSSGKPKVLIGEDGFSARLAEAISEREVSIVEMRTNTLRQFSEKKHSLTEREANLPQLLIVQAGRIENAKAELAKAEKALADSPALLGAGFESNELTARAFINSQQVNFSL